MPKIRPTIARTSEDLADTLGLPHVDAEECQFQHVLLARLKEITRRQKLTHLEIAKAAGTSRTRITSILNNDLEHVSSNLMIRILASLGYRVKVSVVRCNKAA
jgi:predicted XRE-type DNA-binding protein